MCDCVALSTRTTDGTTVNDRPIPAPRRPRSRQSYLELAKNLLNAHVVQSFCIIERIFKTNGNVEEPLREL